MQPFWRIKTKLEFLIKHQKFKCQVSFFHYIFFPYSALISAITDGAERFPTTLCRSVIWSYVRFWVAPWPGTFEGRLLYQLSYSVAARNSFLVCTLVICPWLESTTLNFWASTETSTQWGSPCSFKLIMLIVFLYRAMPWLNYDALRYWVLRSIFEQRWYRLGVWSWKLALYGRIVIKITLCILLGLQLWLPALNEPCLSRSRIRWS